jgi:hypothetical protein
MRFLACAASLLSIAAPAPGHAQENLDIDCPSLAADTQAELLARLRAEIGFRQAATYVSVACDQEQAIVALIAEGEVRRAELPLIDPDDDRALKERLLDRVAELVAPTPEQTAESAEPAPAAFAPVRPDLTPTYDEPSPPTHDPATTALVQLGMRGQSWGGAAVGDLGPRLLLGFASGRFELGAGIAGAWALASPHGLHARSVSTLLVADGWALESLALGGGLGLSWVTISSPATTEIESTRVVFAMARARAKLVLGELVACLGPELYLNDQQVTARKAGTDVFRIPTLILGVGIDLTMLRAKL